MLISILSQEQLRRQSPMPVPRAARGVKPPGSLGLGQPATALDRIKLPESFAPAAFLDLWVFVLAFEWETRKSRNNC